MIIKPQVTGIAAVDENGAICFRSKGNDVDKTIGRFYNNDMSALDFTILKTTVNSMISRGAVFVMGEGVRVDMKHFFNHINSDRVIVSTPSITPDNLIIKAFRAALTYSPTGKEIVVLGGRTVYNAFKEHYDGFLLTEFGGGAPSSDKFYTKDIQPVVDRLKSPSFEKETIMSTSFGKVTQYFKKQ